MENNQHNVENLTRTRDKLNRKIPPPIRRVGKISLPQPHILTLPNGLKVFLLDFPGQELVKMEIVFKAGRPEESTRLASRSTARLIRDGSRNRSGAEIAEQIDFYGGSFTNPSSLDFADFNLYGLRKFIPNLLPVFAEALWEPTFPEKELQTFVNNSVQELLIDLGKVEIVAYRKLTEQLFGTEHPYGYNSSPDDYRALLRDHLIAHHRDWYTPHNAILFVSGHIDDPLVSLVEQYFGNIRKTGRRPGFPAPAPDRRPATLHIPQPGAFQTAIKIGRRLFQRKHPDYNGMYVLNTILGGYFGSRLMANIREKKGYTYNIYSTVDTFLHDGYFYIATEVNADKTAAAIRQIFKELQTLREKPVDNDELDMVRNYLLGMLLNSLDGPLNTADLVKSLVTDELETSDFEALANDIQQITPLQLQELANRYLQPDDLWTLTVG